MYFIMQPDERPDGYVHLSTSTQWQRWLLRTIPRGLDRRVRSHLVSNLKHLLVGLELKAALIEPHQNTEQGQRNVLFEPYFQIMIMEFCVGTFSVLEGMGAAHWLEQNGQDGADGPRIGRNDWRAALCNAFDETGELELGPSIDRTLEVRDKLHQDRLAMRDDIDWHAFNYDVAFTPAIQAIQVLLRKNEDAVPNVSNLPIRP